MADKAINQRQTGWQEGYEARVVGRLSDNVRIAGHSTQYVCSAELHAGRQFCV
jgi:hypothetical protein